MISMTQCLSALAWLHWPTNLDRFCTNPDIPGEKRTKTDSVGGWVIQLVAALLFAFFSQMQALSQCVLCAEMGVAWHILGVGEVSDP